MIIRFLILTFILIWSGGHSGAHAESILAIADGKWQGVGWGRRNVGDPKRATKCLFDFSFSSDTKMLALSGNCAGGGRSGKITGNVVEISDRSFTGRWQASGGLSASNMSGTRSGNRIVLMWRSKQGNSDTLKSFSMQWTITTTQISLSIFAGEGQQNVLSNLIMRR